jgi:DNA-directed RNA polymerase subunit alpha
MLECLEFREEKNFLKGESLSYGKFAFSRLEKGQGLTVANTLRRVLLYEIPAVGITSVFIRTTNNTVKKKEESSKVETKVFEQAPPEASPPDSGAAVNQVSTNEQLLLSETASSHNEFSTLSGVKESVLELLFNLKSIVFENFYSYSSIQKGSLKLKVNTEFTANIQEFQIKASQLILPSELRLIYPDHVLATLITPTTPFELEFTIEKITQSDLTSTSSFSGRAPNRSTRNRRILPIDGTIFPVKKVNYTIEQDSFGKEIVFFEIWTNGGIHPRAAIFQSLEKVVKLFQTFQE